MAVKIELSFQGSCQKPLEAKSAANGLLSGFWCLSRKLLFLADRAEQEKDSQRTKTEKVQAFLCSEVIYQTQAAVASDGHRVV